MAFICAAANHAAALAARVLELEGALGIPDFHANRAEELRGALDRAHRVFAAESDARAADMRAARLRGAIAMYEDVAKAFPLTAPAEEYAGQLLARLDKEAPHA